MRKKSLTFSMPLGRMSNSGRIGRMQVLETKSLSRVGAKWELFT